MSDDRLMNHKLHIILTFITFGMWWPFYLGLYVYYKFSGSTIETRRIKRASARETRQMKQAKIKEDRRITQNLIKESARKGYTYETSSGYKKGNWISSQNYTLACGHQISAKKQVGIFSKGLINRTVRCEICNTDRTVTGTLYPWNNK